jgi:transposase
VDSRLDPIATVAHYYRVNPKKARRNYKQQKGGYKDWQQAKHAEDYLLYPKNLTPNLAIDEVSFSQGELYTVVSSRDREGRAKKLVAIVKGTQSESILKVLNRIELTNRLSVKEVSLDMAPNMRNVCKMAFPNATLVTDRFHVVRLVMDAMQHVRIDQRWKEIDKENDAIKTARRKGTKYKPIILSNGDTPKQLLARSRYLLYKLPHQWTLSQVHRAALLFKMYPTIERAYRLAIDFRAIYNNSSKAKAQVKFHEWVQQAKDAQLEYFNTVCEAVKNHMDGILAFFNNRSTNAHAESLNAQIKLFRANLRGVSNNKLFLYRLEKVFA